MAPSAERPRAPFVLLVAALLLAAAGTGVALGTGLLRLPMTVEGTIPPASSASGEAVGTQRPGDSPSATPAGDPAALAGRTLFVEAEGLRLRAEPSENADILATLRRGQVVGATAGQASSDGMTWYEVLIGPGALRGWVAAGPDTSWLRLVENGAVAFRCEDCGASPALVSVTPAGDHDISALGGEELADHTWSPDGTRLAATRGDVTSGTIVVMDPDGSNVRELGPGQAPSWSPDGTRLAWLSDGLVVTDADLNPSPLDLSLIGIGRPSWSADGGRLAFVAIDCLDCPPDEPIFGDPPTAIFTVAADGSDLRQLTARQTEGAPAWSPDGRWLAFNRYDLSGERPTQALVISAAGGEPTTLLGGGAVHGQPAWSPDGSRMAIPSSDGLVVLDGNGANPRVIVASTDTLSVGAVHWSPAGDQLLFETAGDTSGGGLELWVVPADGSSGATLIVGNGVHGSMAAWQPVLAPLP